MTAEAKLLPECSFQSDRKLHYLFFIIFLSYSHVKILHGYCGKIKHWVTGVCLAAASDPCILFPGGPSPVLQKLTCTCSCWRLSHSRTSPWRAVPVSMADWPSVCRQYTAESNGSSHLLTLPATNSAQCSVLMPVLLCVCVVHNIPLSEHSTPLSANASSTVCLCGTQHCIPLSKYSTPLSANASSAVCLCGTQHCIPFSKCSTPLSDNASSTVCLCGTQHCIPLSKCSTPLSDNASSTVCLCGTQHTTQHTQHTTQC